MSKAHIPPLVAIRGHATLIGKKEKWINKRTVKQYVADFFYTQYNLSYLMFVPNFKIRGLVVPKKYLTKNIGVRDRKTENRKRRQKINLGILVLFTVILFIVYRKFEDCITHRYGADKMEKCWKERTRGPMVL